MYFTSDWKIRMENDPRFLLLYELEALVVLISLISAFFSSVHLNIVRVFAIILFKSHIHLRFLALFNSYSPASANPTLSVFTAPSRRGFV